MIDGHTKIYGILGRPVSHSLSPAMHNAAFRELGLNAVYVPFPVTDLSQAVAGLRGLAIAGASVTIPFKEEIIPLLDELDPQAARMGAVNTVVNREGRLIGYNTDWLGAVTALKAQTAWPGSIFSSWGPGRGPGHCFRHPGKRRAGSLSPTWTRPGPRTWPGKWGWRPSP